MELFQGGGREDAETGLRFDGRVFGRGANFKDFTAPEHHPAPGRVHGAGAHLPDNGVHAQRAAVAVPARGQGQGYRRQPAPLHRCTSKCVDVTR